MEISAQLVKQLRERTGAGMMECKKALVESKGDLGEAEQLFKQAAELAAAAGNEVSAVTVLPDGSAWSVGASYPAGSAPQAVSRQICPAQITGSGFAPATVRSQAWQSVAWLTG